MSVYRDKTSNSWITSCRFRDTNGAPKRTTKRGFKTKEEAKEWERELKANSGLRTLTLSEFFRVYKRNIIPTVVVPNSRVTRSIKCYTERIAGRLDALTAVS